MKVLELYANKIMKTMRKFKNKDYFKDFPLYYDIIILLYYKNYLFKLYSLLYYSKK